MLRRWTESYLILNYLFNSIYVEYSSTYVPQLYCIYTYFCVISLYYVHMYVCMYGQCASMMCGACSLSLSPIDSQLDAAELPVNI